MSYYRLERDIMINFEVLSKEDCEQVRIWRNQNLAALRTSMPLTKEQQEEFYYNVVCNRQANAKYWGIHDEFGTLIGMSGLENISWENRHGEISLILSPDVQKQGYGRKAVDKLIEIGRNLNLTVWGETYFSSPAIGFWTKLCIEKGAYTTTLIKRKAWEGNLYPSLYFVFREEG